MTAVRVLVGTRKGAFVLTSDGKRQKWDVAGPYFGGWEIYHMKGSPVDPNRIYASQTSSWFGQVIQRSDDGGKTWFQPGTPAGEPTKTSDGMPIGEIIQENVFGKVRFAYVCNGMKVGGIYAENFRAWNFSLRDHTETEVARITKTWQGMAKAMFSTADNYVVQFHRQVPDPLLSMIVASGVTVDTVLSQSQG